MKYQVIVTVFVLVCAVSSLRPHPDAIIPHLHVGKVFDTAHHLAKRQIPSSQDIQDLIDCSATAIDYICGSSGYAQQTVNIALGCGNDSDARNIANTCARSESGAFCGTATIRLTADETLAEGASACGTAVASGSCSATCRSFLQSVSSRLGCCINTYINNTDSTLLSVYSAFVDYRLWSLCDVPLPSADCGNGLPLNPPQNVQSCTVQEYLTRLANYECMASVGQPLVDTLLQDSKCYRIARALVDVCGVNDNNERCGAVLGSDVLGTTGASSDPLFTSLLSNCGSSSSTFCSSSCRSAVNNIANGYGCCVSVLNDTDSQLTALSYGVWSECGVDPPGICTTNTLSGAAAVKAFAWIIAIAIMGATFMAQCV